MDTVPCHPARGCHPREPQGAVAVLTDTQLPRAQDLLSCKNTKERVWIGFHHVGKFMDGVNVFHAEEDVGVLQVGSTGTPGICFQIGDAPAKKFFGYFFDSTKQETKIGSGYISRMNAWLMHGAAAPPSPSPSDTREICQEAWTLHGMSQEAWIFHGMPQEALKCCSTTEETKKRRPFKVSGEVLPISRSFSFS